MAENTKEELEKLAKEKAEAAKKMADEAADKVKNMSADDAKELAKEKAEEATKAAKEAAEKLKNMSADDAKKMAQEKMESVKSLDNTSKMKYGGIALLVVLVLMFVFSGSSYPDGFIKGKVAKKDMVVADFSIQSEEEIEVFGHKGISLVLNVTYEAPEGKVLCQYDFLRKKTWTSAEKMEKERITTVKTEKECLNLRYSNGGVSNQKVISSVEKIRTITFGKEDIIRWKAKQK